MGTTIYPYSPLTVIAPSEARSSDLVQQENTILSQDPLTNGYAIRGMTFKFNSPPKKTLRFHYSPPLKELAL